MLPLKPEEVKVLCSVSYFSLLSIKVFIFASASVMPLAFLAVYRCKFRKKTRFFNKIMAKEITKRSENYSQWYNDLALKADLAEQSAVRGCMVIKPYGYAIWEKMQRIMDDKFKQTGVQNAYFPLFIPKSFFSREAEHVANLLVKLVKQAAEFLGESYDVEIVEKHHNQKVDAPSGTALMLADSVNEQLGSKYKYIYDRSNSHEKRSQK